MVEVHYYHESANDGPYIVLAAYAPRADAVRFKVTHTEETAVAVGRKNRAITGNNGHPWEALRSDGGIELYGLMMRSVNETGGVRVTVIAKNDAGRTKVSVSIAFNGPECRLDPPLYPWDCMVEP